MYRADLEPNPKPSVSLCTSLSSPHNHIISSAHLAITITNHSTTLSSPSFLFPPVPTAIGSDDSSVNSLTSHSTTVFPSLLLPIPLLVFNPPALLAAWIHRNPPPEPCVMNEGLLLLAGVLEVMEIGPFAETGPLVLMLGFAVG